MKYLVASDIHGSLYYAKKVIELFEKEEADKIILLGDLYYHGPRNPLPVEYNPMEVSKLFNEISDNIFCIKGNCDAEVDEMISKFKFSENLVLKINDKMFMFTHGHHINIDNRPKEIDVLVYGHFHTGFIEKVGEVVVANTGSLSLPKNDTPNSYIVLEGDTITLKDLERK